MCRMHVVCILLDILKMLIIYAYIYIYIYIYMFISDISITCE